MTDTTTNAPHPAGATRPADVPGVMVLGSGDLVLTGGNHAVLNLMSAQGRPADGAVATFWDNTAERTRYCASRELAFSTWVFPDKLTIFADDPAFAGQGVGSLYLRHYRTVQSATHAHVHHLGDVITAPDDFQQTDTHLSAAGIRNAVLAMARSLDLPGQDAFAEKVAATWKLEDAHSGDLGVKFTPPMTGRALLPSPVTNHRRGSNGMAAGNDGMMDLLCTPDSVTDKTLLIFGDSFFRQSLGYLTFFFRRIVFLRTRYFHKEMVAAVNPDVVFCGMAERFLSNVIPDDSRCHFLAYPYVKGRALNPSRFFSVLWSEMIDDRQLR